MFKLMKTLSTSIVCMVDFIRLKSLESKSGFCFVLKIVSHWGAIISVLLLCFKQINMPSFIMKNKGGLIVMVYT